MLERLAAAHADPVINVLCDRCRATGRAGAEEFADLKDLLSFDPVPRRTARVDGWTADRQRAFIVALATTGSVRRAAHSIGMSQFGADQLRKAEDSDSFNCAFERAIDLHRQDQADRLARGLGTVTSRRTPGPVPARRGGADRRLRESDPSPEREAALNEQAKNRILESWARKLVAERTYRETGQIAAADFTLRQLTIIELVLDCGDIGLLELLRQTRFGPGFGHLADTHPTRLLDEARRHFWASQDEPPRPPLAPAHLLEDHGTHRTYRSEDVRSGPGVDFNAEFAKFAEQHRRDAEELVSWEAEARADWERRQGGTGE